MECVVSAITIVLYLAYSDTLIRKIKNIFSVYQKLKMASILPLMFFLPYSEGCPQRCGSLSIPYPFGIGPRCSLEASFDVRCDTSSSPPRAYLTTRENMQIMEISPLQIRVKMPNLMFAAYHLDGRPLDATNFTYDLSGTAYSFSGDNWFTVVGCSDQGVITVYLNSTSFAGGCISFCPSSDVPGNLASCIRDDLGLVIGCCRFRIPKGTTSFRMYMADAHELYVRNLHWSQRFFHASYAFIGEKASNESTDDQPRLSDLNINASEVFLRDSWAANHMPLGVLDWRITGADNCSEATKNRSTYACQAHSDCVDFQPGYLCECSKGYYGNPYLESGCQADVDGSWMHDELRR